MKEKRLILERFSISNEFTKNIRECAPQCLSQVFFELGISSKKVRPKKTFFLRPEDQEELELLFNTPLIGLNGCYYLDGDCCLVFLTGNVVADTQAYFHEQVHSLGKVFLANFGDVFFSQVGYSSQYGDGARIIYSRGELLEESIVDWIAQKASLLTLRKWGVELPDDNPEGYIAEAGRGKLYRYLRGVIIYLTKNAPDLLSLLVRARFQPELRGQLMGSIKKHYGWRAVQPLFRLDHHDPELIDAVVTDLVTR